MSRRDLLLLATIVLVAWLTAGGFAVRSVSRIWLRHWAERRLRGAASALTYLDRPQRLLGSANAVVALGVVLCGMLLGARAGGPWLLGHLVLYAAGIVLLGQLLPRAIACRWPTIMVPIAMPVLRASEVVATPVVALGRLASRPFERPVATDHDPSTTEHDALHDLLLEGELEGVGEHDEIAIISGVVQFGEKRVREVMTPRADVFALADALDARSLASRIAQSGYSRVPIYHGTIDQVVGMLHAFDVLKAGGDAIPPLRAVAVASPADRCNDLLFRMLRERRHLAIVRDPAIAPGQVGLTVGLVTLEDLLEELVGDIRDEHDDPEPVRPADPGASNDLTA